MDKTKVPDAWDDGWDNAVDQQQPVKAPSATKISKRERRAAHAEFNRQLWQTADAEPRFEVEQRDYAPVKSDFKVPMTLLSRRPAEIKKAPGEGEELDEEEEEERRRVALSAEERKAKMQKEREEKERKYQEVRERLFGSPSVSTVEKESQNTRGRGRRGTGNGSSRSSGRNSPALHGKGPSVGRGKDFTDDRKEPVLFDAEYAPKPGSIYLQKQAAGFDNTAAASGTGPAALQKPVREPKGPDGSGRGGFGFATRGAKS